LKFERKLSAFIASNVEREVFLDLGSMEAH